jgi:hypothetical protein
VELKMIFGLVAIVLLPTMTTAYDQFFAYGQNKYDRIEDMPLVGNDGMTRENKLRMLCEKIMSSPSANNPAIIIDCLDRLQSNSTANTTNTTNTT